MKYNKILIIFLAAVLLAGCAKSGTPIMNELAEDNMYHYSNPDFGFSIDFPKEFIYYQTQSKTQTEFKDLEFFVPTNDPDYIEFEVPSYAKPVVVRVYDKSYWEKIKTPDDANMIFNMITEKDGQVYTIKFWDKIPKDWKDKWTEEMKQGIKESFKLE